MKDFFITIWEDIKIFVKEHTIGVIVSVLFFPSAWLISLFPSFMDLIEFIVIFAGSVVVGTIIFFVVLYIGNVLERNSRK